MSNEDRSSAVPVEIASHSDDGDGHSRPVLLRRLSRSMRAISSAALGGGLGICDWVINAEVSRDYHRSDPQQHLAEISAQLGLPDGRGVGLMTAADVRAMTSCTQEGVRCDATVGLSFPTWACAPQDEPLPEQRWKRHQYGWQPGTINLVCWLPVALCDAALVNTVITATEAKTQALLDAAVPGTGTASDAIVVCCPQPTTHSSVSYGGPRSLIGASLARAVYGAVAAGTQSYLDRRS